jgi:hypothetical protein
MTSLGTALATEFPLSAVARHVVAPLGIVSTSWPKVEQTCARLGWRFDGWQDGAGRLILSKRSDGEYAADTIVISIPRQVGKTYLIACIIFALCLLEPGLKVIWTAHRKSTSAETFRTFDAMSNRPKVRPHVRQVLRGKGDESVWFHNGSSIEFGARESGFGRGRSDVDVLVFDEGQMLPESTLEDMGATQNVAKNPLTFVMGTPPRQRDAGEFFRLLRDEALSGDSEGTLYIEFSADEDADPMDRDQWRTANPSFPARTSERAMLRLRKKLKSDDSWRREALGIWDAKAAVVIPLNLWETLEAEGPSGDTPPAAMSVDASHDGALVAAACWLLDDQPHVELLAAGEWSDDNAAADWIAERAERKMAVVIDTASPAARLIPLLQARGVKVVSGTAQGMAKACGGFYAAVVDGLLTWGGPNGYLIGRAVAGAKKRKIGEAGGWGWDRRDPETIISPLVAVTLAHYGASNAKKRGSGRSSDGRKGTSL